MCLEDVQTMEEAEHEEVLAVNAKYEEACDIEDESARADALGKLIFMHGYWRWLSYRPELRNLF